MLQVPSEQVPEEEEPTPARSRAACGVVRCKLAHSAAKQQHAFARELLRADVSPQDVRV